VGLCFCRDFVHAAKLCGSELAHEGGVTFNIAVA